MLIFYKKGPRDFSKDSVPVNSRGAWEFYASLSGKLCADLPDQHRPGRSGEKMLWIFPRDHAHGWTGGETVERLVFHFTAVPGELEQMLPPCGYYQVRLSNEDCDLLCRMAKQAEEIMDRPTKLVFLQTQALVSELSLIALRDIGNAPLTSRKIARNKTEQALGWYSEHIPEAPTFKDVAEAVHVSGTHLRRLFHWARGESPHQAMNRIRMDKAEEFLKSTDLPLDTIASQVGLSNGSALSRAVKAHFGITPRNLRRGRRPLRMTKKEHEITGT